MLNKISSVLCLAATLGLTVLQACHHEHHDHDAIVLYDSDHRFEHHGYYDEHHDWHGGYYDERHVFHDDPHEFAGRP
jgi:hypothetical protein